MTVTILHVRRPGRRLVMRLLLALSGAMLVGCGNQPAATIQPTVLPAASPTSSVGGGQLPTKAQGKLSVRLQMLADPAVSTQDMAAQARALGLPESGSGSLMRNDAGAVLVVVRVSDVAQPTLDALAAAGLASTNVAASFRSVTGYIQPDRLAAVAALPAVENVREELTP